MQKFSVLIAETPDQQIEIDPESVFEAITVDADGAMTRLRDRKSLDGELPALPCIAIVGWEERQIEWLEGVRERFNEVAEIVAPDIVILDQEPSWEGVLAGAFYGFEYFLVEQSRQVNTLSQALGALRQHHETLTANYRALEARVGQQGAELTQESFIAPPEKAFSPPQNKGKSGFDLSQILPVSSEGLAGLSIHVAKADPAATAELEIRLIALGSERVLTLWKANVSALTQGWAFFALPASLDGFPTSLRAEIKVTGKPGRFRLSLGARCPIARYRVHDGAGQEISDATLALKIFTAPPGVMLSRRADAHLPAPDFVAEAPQERADWQRVPMQPSSDPQAYLFAEGASFSAPTAGGGEPCLQLRAQGSEPTSAVIRACLPNGTRAVQCRLHADALRGGGTRARLAVLAERALRDSPAAEDGARGELHSALAFSEWLALPPEHEDVLTLTLQRPLDGIGSVVIFVQNENACGETGVVTITSLAYRAG